MKQKKVIAIILLLCVVFTQNFMISSFAQIATIGMIPLSRSLNMDNEIIIDEDECLMVDEIDDYYATASEIASASVATIANAYLLDGNIAWDGVSTQELKPVGDAYYIQTPFELAWVKKVTNEGIENFKGKTIYILKDLDMGEHEWGGIGTSAKPFYGSIEGNDKSISGIKTTNSSCLGVFGTIIADGELFIKNLNVESAKLTGNASSAGMLIGCLDIKKDAKVKISNCNVSGTIDVGGCNAGGGLIGEVKASENTDISIMSVEVDAEIDIQRSAYTNFVNSAGGLIGSYYNQGQSNDSIKIDGCILDTNLYAKAEIYAETYIGGVLGRCISHELMIDRVYTTGKLSGYAHTACGIGGFIGDCKFDVLNIYNSYTDTELEPGSINPVAGGFIGRLECWQDYEDSVIKNCYVTGQINSGHCAAFIAWNASENDTVLVENCYYNKENSGLESDTMVQYLGTFSTGVIPCLKSNGLTNEQMKDISCYKDWDFINIWSIKAEEYPKLREVVALNEGLIASCRAEKIIYSIQGYETSRVGLEYEVSIDENIILDDWITDTVIAKAKITLPKGLSFSSQSEVSETYISMPDSDAPNGYIYLELGNSLLGIIDVYVSPDAPKTDAFKCEISVTASGFNSYSSFGKIPVVMKEERPAYIPVDAYYNELNGHWYKMYQEKDILSWYDAAQKCKELNGYLVTITSLEEQKFIESIPLNNNCIWLGGRTENKEWKWVTGEKFEYTNWASEEGKETKLSYMLTSAEDAYKWSCVADMSANESHFFICEWDLSSGESDAQILVKDSVSEEVIEKVYRYTSGDMTDMALQVIQSNVSKEEKARMLYEIYTYFGITDEREGVDILLNSTKERMAYDRLTIDSLYTSYLYKEFLNSPEGTGARLALIGDGLVFNNELSDMISLDTATGNLPGVKKYKQMLLDFMEVGDMQDNTFTETTGYAKEIIKFLKNLEKVEEISENSVLKSLVEELETDKKSIEEINSMVVERFGKDAILIECLDKKYTYEFKDCKLQDALGISSNIIKVADFTLEDIFSFFTLKTKLAVIQEYEDFLSEVCASKDLPWEMRTAAGHLLLQIQLDYITPMIKLFNDNFSLAVDTIEVNKLDNASFNKTISTFKIAEWVADSLMGIGELTKKSQYVEAYGYLTEHFAKRLKGYAVIFENNPTVENAWDFYNTYTLLYNLRLKGEEAYADMCDVSGIAFKAYKLFMQESAYQAHIDIAKGNIKMLQEKCGFDVSDDVLDSNEVIYKKKIVTLCPVSLQILNSKGEVVAILNDGQEMDEINSYGRFIVKYIDTMQGYAKIVYSNEDNLSVSIDGEDNGLMTLKVNVQGDEIYTLENYMISPSAKMVLKTFRDKVTLIGKEDGSETTMPIQKVKKNDVHDVIELHVDEELHIRKGEVKTIQTKISPQDATYKALKIYSPNTNIIDIKEGAIKGIEVGVADVYVSVISAGITKTIKVMVLEELQEELQEQESLVIITPKEVQYSDTPIKLLCHGGTTGKAVFWELIGGTGEGEIQDSTLIVDKCGSFEVMATMEGDEQYNKVSTYGTITVKKATRNIDNVEGKISKSEDGDYIFTVTEPLNEEYSKNGNIWQENNVFSEIKAGTVMTFFVRAREDVNYVPGNIKSITVKFPKFSSGSSITEGTTITNSKSKVLSYYYLPKVDEHIYSGKWQRDDKGWWLQLENGNGYARRQWACLNGTWYLFSEDGYMLVGWVCVQGKWYYLRTSGDMAVGWVQDEGKWYYLGADGSMLVSTVTPDGYWIGSDGVWNK